MFKESQFFGLDRTSKEPKPEKAVEREKEIEQVDPNKEESKDISPEEAEEDRMLKELWEEMEKEIELRKALENWIEKSKPILQQRAKHFGMSNSIVEEIQKNLRESFKKDMNIVTDEDEIKNIKEASFERVSDLLKEMEGLLKESEDGKLKPEPEKLEKLRGDRQKLEEVKIFLLSQKFSKKYFLDVLNRKLNGEAIPVEKDMLDIFSEVKKGGKSGSHDPFSGEIEVSFLNSKDFKECTGTLMHEITHKALASLLPEITRQEISIGVCRALGKELTKERVKKEEITEEEKVQNLFFQYLLAINESFAHQVVKYYEVKPNPQYVAYRDKTHPKLFKEVYSHIETVTEGKSLLGFDQMTVYIYKFFTDRWDKNLSMEDLKRAARDTVEEINKFITK